MRRRKDGLNCDCKQCCRERVAAYQASLGEDYKRRKAEYDRVRVAELKNVLSEQARARYEAKREEKIAYAAKWAAQNPEKRRAISQTYKHRRRAVEREGVSSADLLAWKKAQPKRCYWCSKDCKRGYVVDHYQPLAKGGKHEIANLVIACRSCNARKSARDPLDFAREVWRLL